MALALRLNRQFAHGQHNGHDNKKKIIANEIQLNTEWNWMFATLFTVAWSTRKLLHFFNEQKNLGFASIHFSLTEKKLSKRWEITRTHARTLKKQMKPKENVRWYCLVPLRFIIFINFFSIATRHRMKSSQVTWNAANGIGENEWCLDYLGGEKKMCK